MCGVIVVDADHFGLLDTDVMPMFMIIALDVVIIMRSSINCSAVICSPTIIHAILREATSETYGPRGLFSIILSLFSKLLNFIYILLVSILHHAFISIFIALWTVITRYVIILMAIYYILMTEVKKAITLIHID